MPSAQPNLIELEQVELIDLDQIQELKSMAPGNPLKMIIGLSEIFCREAPKRLEKIEAALATGDMAVIIFESHALKSSCANMGGKRMSRIALEIETRAKAGQMEGLESLYQLLRQTYTPTNEFIESLKKTPA